jgi:hypothetical protein
MRLWFAATLMYQITTKNNRTMSKTILTGIMLTLTVCMAIAKGPKPNTDLMGSLQHSTTYVLEQSPNYQKTENYLFYSDNTCTMQTVLEHCTTGAITKHSAQLRWLIVNNYIVLLNSAGKTERYFVAKDNVKHILTGQKSIAEFKQIETDEAAGLFANNLKGEQVCYVGQKP